MTGTSTDSSPSFYCVSAVLLGRLFNPSNTVFEILGARRFLVATERGAGRNWWGSSSDPATPRKSLKDHESGVLHSSDVLLRRGGKFLSNLARMEVQLLNSILLTLSLVKSRNKDPVCRLSCRY